MTLESAPVDLRQTIEATVEMVAADAVKKGLEIAYRLHPELQNRRILGDTIRIRQVGISAIHPLPSSFKEVTTPGLIDGV